MARQTNFLQSIGSRRDWLRNCTAGMAGLSGLSWLETLAQAVADHPQRKKSCILLWMSGGPSQIDTFDLKPDHENGGEFKEIATKTAGLRISEHLPKIAQWSNELAIIRSMTSKEGDHTRATYYVRTGQLPQGLIQYPTLGSMIGKELGQHKKIDLPSFVSIAPSRVFGSAAFSPGFLGSRFAPLIVGETRSQDETLQVRNLDLPEEVSRQQANARLSILSDLQQDFLADHPDLSVASHLTAYEQSTRMMRKEIVDLFDLSSEPEKVRDAYGRNRFGQGCLLARRLVEHGVPFVEVSLSNTPDGGIVGWDTHQNNFQETKNLSEVLDPAWATLMKELKERGLLESTLIVWMGEFGRTPKINANSGRDHFPAAWSAVLAGGGIAGGQAIGKTGLDGTTIEERPTSVIDLLATICLALGIDPATQNMSKIGRPIPLVAPEAEPIKEILS